MSACAHSWSSTGRRFGSAFARAHPRSRASSFRRLASRRGAAVMAGGTGLFARAPASDASWNPATDLALATNYDLHMRPGDVEYNTEIEREVHDHVAGKAANKLVTQREYGLDEDPGAPLVGFVADLSDRASARPRRRGRTSSSPSSRTSSRTGSRSPCTSPRGTSARRTSAPEAEGSPEGV